MPRFFRIHPSIGAARVGDSPTEHFVGPEHPDIPANWSEHGFGSFRDSQGRIKRQAAKFRIFEYVKDGQGRLASPAEVAVGGDIVDIEWRVHLANRKASFLTFNGQSGADDLYLARKTKKRPTDLEKEGGDGDPQRLNYRNAGVTDDSDLAREQAFDIDAGEQVISHAHPASVVLANQNPSTRGHIPDLGELQLDGDCLLVLGGHGTSTPTTPNAQIDEYANNDGWLDDVSDGSVKARVRLKDGSFEDADASWVIVGPPDFAPAIGNVVSLYDLMWDIAVQQLSIPADNALFDHAGPLGDIAKQKQIWQANSQQSLAGYSPSFTREIYPLLQRAFRARWAFDGGEANAHFHFKLTELSMLSGVDGGTPRDPSRLARDYFFTWIRDPRAAELTEEAWKKMPRGLGDDYDDLHDGPKLTSLLSLTHIQYALLEQWVKGSFIADWPKAQGDEELDVPPPGEISPERLDRAAIENCVGGPFYPGIEVSWLVRRPELYAEPFRLKVAKAPETTDTPPLRIGDVLQFRPGFFSQQMAQPWQADFYDCHKEKHRSPANIPYTFMWWTAQRPDDVFPSGSKGQAGVKRHPWVLRFIPDRDEQKQSDFENDNERFRQMQSRWKELRFIVGDKTWFEEEPENAK